MPFNGAGVYSAPGADFPAVTQTVISSTHYNNVINDLATALSLTLTRDGQATATANIPFGGFRATNVGITAIAGSVGTPAINVSDAATGLYRSAASELAVTVAGTQRARFDSTGLIVTGLITLTTTLTAPTSVVTPLIGTDTAANLVFKTNGVSRWNMDNASVALFPTTDGSSTIGGPSNRIGQIYAITIDSGTTGSLSLKTNNGTTQFIVAHTAGTIVNNWQATGNITTLAPQLLATGTDANVPGQIATKGTGTLSFVTDALGTPRTQLQLLHGTGANNLTITNGANPTIGVTAGSLAITPAVVIAGASLQIGTNPSSVGPVGVPYGNALCTRNNANTGDIVAVLTGSLNGVADIVSIGVTAASNGVRLKARSGGAALTTSDLLPGEFTVWRDTVGATTKLYYNNASTLQSVTLS